MIKLFARPRVCDKAFRKLLFREGGSLLNTASDLSALAPYWSLVIPAFLLQIKQLIDKTFVNGKVSYVLNKKEKICFGMIAEQILS